MSQNDFDFLTATPQRFRRRPKRRFPTVTILLITGACCMGGCCVFTGVIALVSPGMPSEPGKMAPRKDPYTPDCAIVRQHLENTYGDVEIVSWGKRTIVNDTTLGGCVFLSVRFRVRGGKIRDGLFTIGPFNTVEQSTISD